MWIIWQERNARCFEDQERSMEKLKKLLIQTLFHWTEACIVPKISTISQFLSFKFLVLPLVRFLFVYFLYIRVAPLCTFQ